MELFHIFILAVVQGLSEFLPISSTAHLTLASYFLKQDIHPLYVDIWLHAATLLAVVSYFFRDVVALFKSFFFAPNYKTREYADALIIATIPILFAGLLLYQSISVLRTPLIVATALFVSGLALIVADYVARHNLTTLRLTFRKKGFGVGLFQVLALIPGVSRSGITIAACRSLGFSRREATKFSFLLSIPIICMALIFAMVQGSQSFDSLFSAFSMQMSVGFVVAFVIAYATIHYFIKLVDRIGFVPFFIYQVIIGLLLILFV